MVKVLYIELKTYLTVFSAVIHMLVVVSGFYITLSCLGFADQASRLYPGNNHVVTSSIKSTNCKNIFSHCRTVHMFVLYVIPRTTTTRSILLPYTHNNHIPRTDAILKHTLYPSLPHTVLFLQPNISVYNHQSLNYLR